MRIFSIVLLLLPVQSGFLRGQAATAKPSQVPSTNSTANHPSTPSNVGADTDPTKKIADGLAKQNNADFELQIGIGSLIRNGSVTDYVNNANTLSATSLGWATPQYLLGVSLRSRFKNFTGMRPKYDCDLPKPKGNPSGVTGGEPKPTTEISKSTTEESKTTSDTGVTTTTTTTKTTKTTTTTTKPPSGGDNNTLASTGKTDNPETAKPKKADKPRIPDSMAYEDACPVWQTRPWSGFVSLKFSPNASSVLNGYVFGGSYGLMRYLNILVGFSLTPVSVPAPGLRTSASLFVTEQQKQGNYLQFNPVAMANNEQNAFDGFSLVNSNGTLIYSGTPLETDYRGGVVVGFSIPLSFSGFLQSGK